MILKLASLSLVFLFTLHLKSANSFELKDSQLQVIIEVQNTDSIDQISIETPTLNGVKFKRGKAIAFTVLTGLFGGHRIYFGTHHRTPIIYSITLGGLGVLPFIDLINIIFTKDLSVFEHKHQIIMWGK